MASEALAVFGIEARRIEYMILRKLGKTELMIQSFVTRYLHGF